VNASQAAINPLPFIPGLDLSGKKISARFVMRKE
jgi:hypothetical protein